MNNNTCVNCGIRFQRNVRQHLCISLSPVIKQILFNWISRDIEEQEGVCGKCLQILGSVANNQTPERQFGYKSVCFPCGSSILRAAHHDVRIGSVERNVIISWISSHQVNYLKSVCMACWLRARRAVERNHQQDVDRQAEGLIENRIPAPPPPPAAPLIVPADLETRQSQVATITMLTYKRTSSTSRHCIFPGCENQTRLLVPIVLKESLLLQYSLFIPRSARICRQHLHDHHNDWNDLVNADNIREFSAIQMEEVCALLKNGSQRHHNIENIIQSNEMLCKYWLGISIQQFNQLLNEIPALSTQNVDCKTALAIYLVKIRTGDSHRRIASIFNLAPSSITVYLNIVRACFEEQFLPLHIGINTLSRELVAQYNLIIPNGLFGNPNADFLEDMPAICICDGTYIYVQKSSNYSYQKQTYSLHKYRNLVKPFFIVCCNGYIIDVSGPYPATMNDADIIKYIFRDGSPLRQFFRPGDIFILDRGFRDAITYLENLGYKVHVPESLDEDQHQLTTLQANKSRLVTMCRWVVEVVNGRIKRDYKIFKQEYLNNASTHLMLDFKIAASLINRFHRLIENCPDAVQILHLAHSRVHTPNQLALFVQQNNMNRLSRRFSRIDGNLPELSDFLRLTLNDLRLISLGVYQIKQARSYYGEHIRENGRYEIEVCRDTESLQGHELYRNNFLVRGKIKSRHASGKKYFTYILVNNTSQNTVDAIAGYCCNCLVGNRTVGCCAHVMTIIWFLGWARHENNINAPALHLDEILLRDDTE